MNLIKLIVDVFSKPIFRNVFFKSYFNFFNLSNLYQLTQPKSYLSSMIEFEKIDKIGIWGHWLVTKMELKIKIFK